MVAETATDPFTFPQFLSLPPELRYQIWRGALPEKDGPALFPYRRGCWCPRRLSKSDEGWDPNDNLNLNLEFRHDLLDYATVLVPLAFVNREARGIALSWVREQGIEMRFREDIQSHVLVRRFDPMRDALYIPLDKVDDFCAEPHDRMFGSDLYNRNVQVGPDVMHIAVPEALFQDDPATIPEIFEMFSFLRVLFVVVDPQPDLENDGTKVQRRLELQSKPGKAFYWNSDHGGFDLGNGEYIGDENLYRRIELASKGLGEMAAQNYANSFEIRPVFAVTR